jgi:hypothetical protein
MEKAEERKNMPKMKGIMSSNPFFVLPMHELDDMADKFGEDINEQVVDYYLDPSISSSSSVSLLHLRMRGKRT